MLRTWMHSGRLAALALLLGVGWGPRQAAACTCPAGASRAPGVVVVDLKFDNSTGEGWDNAIDDQEFQCAIDCLDGSGGHAAWQPPQDIDQGMVLWKGADAHAGGVKLELVPGVCYEFRGSGAKLPLGAWHPWQGPGIVEGHGAVILYDARGLSPSTRLVCVLGHVPPPGAQGQDIKTMLRRDEAWIVRDVTFRALPEAPPPRGCELVAVALEVAPHSVVQDCRFEGPFSVGVDLRSSFWARVERCVFDGLQGPATWLWSDVETKLPNGAPDPAAEVVTPFWPHLPDAYSWGCDNCEVSDLLVEFPDGPTSGHHPRAVDLDSSDNVLVQGVFVTGPGRGSIITDNQNEFISGIFLEARDLLAAFPSQPKARVSQAPFLLEPRSASLGAGRFFVDRLAARGSGGSVGILDGDQADVAARNFTGLDSGSLFRVADAATAGLFWFLNPDGTARGGAYNPFDARLWLPDTKGSTTGQRITNRRLESPRLKLVPWWSSPFQPGMQGSLEYAYGTLGYEPDDDKCQHQFLIHATRTCGTRFARTSAPRDACPPTW